MFMATLWCSIHAFFFKGIAISIKQKNWAALAAFLICSGKINYPTIMFQPYTFPISDTPIKFLNKMLQDQTKSENPHQKVSQTYPGSSLLTMDFTIPKQSSFPHHCKTTFTRFKIKHLQNYDIISNLSFEHPECNKRTASNQPNYEAFYKQTKSMYNLTKRKQATYKETQNFTKICYLWLQ